jgi:hypothetical protein
VTQQAARWLEDSQRRFSRQAAKPPSRQAAKNGKQFLLLQKKPHRPLSLLCGFAALRLGARLPFSAA